MSEYSRRRGEWFWDYADRYHDHLKNGDVDEAAPAVPPAPSEPPKLTAEQARALRELDRRRGGA